MDQSNMRGSSGPMKRNFRAPAKCCRSSVRRSGCCLLHKWRLQTKAGGRGGGWSAARSSGHRFNRIARLGVVRIELAERLHDKVAATIFPHFPDFAVAQFE